MNKRYARPNRGDLTVPRTFLRFKNDRVDRRPIPRFLSLVRALALRSTLFRDLLGNFRRLLRLLQKVSKDAMGRLAFLIGRVDAKGALIYGGEGSFPLKVQVRQRHGLFPLVVLFRVDVHILAASRRRTGVLVSLVAQVGHFLRLNRFFLTETTPNYGRASRGGLSFRINEHCFSVRF